MEVWQFRYSTLKPEAPVIGTWHYLRLFFHTGGGFRSRPPIDGVVIVLVLVPLNRRVLV